MVVTSTQGLRMPYQKVPWSSEYRGMIDSGKGITMEQWLFGIPRAQSGAAQAGLIRGFTNSGFCRDSGIEAPSWPPKDLPKTAVPLTGKCGTAEVSEVFGSKAFVTRAGVLFFDPLDSDTVGFMRMHGSDSVYCQVPAQDAVEFATQVDGKAGDADFDQFVGPYAPKVLKNNRTRLQSARYGCSPLPNTSQIDVTAGQSDSVLGSLRRVDGPRGFNRIFGVSARDNPSPLASVDFAPDSLGGYVFSGRCKDGSPAFRGLNNVNGIASQPGGISTGGVLPEMRAGVQRQAVPARKTGPDEGSTEGVLSRPRETGLDARDLGSSRVVFGGLRSQDAGRIYGTPHPGLHSHGV